MENLIRWVYLPLNTFFQTQKLRPYKGRALTSKNSKFAFEVPDIDRRNEPLTLIVCLIIHDMQF